MDDTRGDKILTNNFYNHFAALISLIIVLILLLTLLVWFRFDEGFVTVFTIAFIIDAIPTLYLHFEYWLKNKGERYEVGFDELVRYKSGKREAYKTSEMEKVEVYVTSAL